MKGRTRSKGLRTLCLTLALAALVCMLQAPAAMADTSVRIDAKDSAGNPLQGVQVQYHSSYWRSFGTTDVNGQVWKSLADGNYNFRAQYNATTSGTQNADVNSSSPVPLLIFQTKAAKVKVQDSNTAPIEGAKVDYHASYWRHLGDTDSSGIATRQLFGDSHTFHAQYNATTSASQTGDIDDDPATTFQTKKQQVGVRTEGDAPIEGAKVDYHASYWRHLGNTDSGGVASKELFGAQHTLRAQHNATTSSTETGDADSPDSYNNAYTFFTETQQVKVIDSSGNPISAAKVDYHASYWRHLGDTDSTGKTSKELFGCAHQLRAQYNATTAATQTGDSCPGDGEGNATVFQTEAAEVKVADCDGTGIEGAKVDYHASYWRHLGNTDSSGLATKELFDGERKFRAQLNATTSATETASDLQSSPDVTFNPTKVTFGYSGTIQYHASYWRTFTKPTMYLFQGTRAFKFDGAREDLDITGCEMDSDVVVIKLLDSTSAGISGGTAAYRFGNGGSWRPIPGSTDANGILIHHFENLTDSQKKILNIRMRHLISYNNKIQNIDTNSTYVFQTIHVTTALEDSDGNTVPDDGFHYRIANGGSWQVFTSPMELLPLTNYNFRVKLGPAYKNKIQNIKVDPDVVFVTITTTTKLQDSDGNPVPDDGFHYRVANGGSWQIFNSPQEMLPITNYNFRVKMGPAYKNKIQDITSDPVVIFETITTTLSTVDCDDNDVSGATYTYRVANGGSWLAITSPKELLPITNYNFRAKLGIAYNNKIQDITSDPDVVYTTTTVVSNWSGTTQYRIANGGSWQTFTSPTEMLPLSNYNFKFLPDGGSENPANITGCDHCFSPVIMRLKDGNGNGIAGGTASYRFGNSGSWMPIPGSTGSDGELRHDFGCLTDYEKSHLNIRMEKDGSYDNKTQNITVNSVYEFQMEFVTVELRNSSNALIDTGTVKYYHGGWKTFGTTSGGQVSKYLYPKNYKFRMTYEYASNEKYQDVGSNQTVVFQTTNVVVELRDSTTALIDAGTVKYYAGGWRTFGTTSGGDVSKQLLPNKYKFRMTYEYASNEKYQQVGTDPTVVFQTTNVVVELRNSDSNLMDTGTVKYYAGGWRAFGTTSGGDVSKELLPNKYKFRMTYAFASNEKYQNVGGNPTVVFQTKDVEVQLKNSSNAFIDTGTVKYYAGGWRAFGDTVGGKVNKELLPNKYKFRITYAFASNEKYQNVGGNSTVVFQTKDVEVQLEDSGNNPLDTGTVKYYAGGWRTFGTTSGGKTNKELLPNNYKFRMTYAHASNEKYQNVGSNSTVIFQTTNVAVQLKDHNGNPLDTGSVKYYAGGWRTFGTTSLGEAKKELLANKYKFRMTYEYASNEKYQQVGTNPTVVFQTTEVVVQLKDHAGALIDTGTVKYYAGGWRTFGSTTSGEVKKELLANKYKFRMTYAFASNEKYQQVGTNPIVVFQTGQVKSGTGTATHYYAGGWRTFTNDMQLLPNKYKFRFNDGTPETYYTISAGTVNNIH